MKIYTMIGGVNGVGKSSFTGVLKEWSTDLGTIVDVDRITAELGGQRPRRRKSRPDHHSQLHQPGNFFHAGDIFS